MPPPGAKVNGLELALQRAWVDAAARRAKRDSLGALVCTDQFCCLTIDCRRHPRSPTNLHTLQFMESVLGHAKELHIFVKDCMTVL